MNRVYLFAGVCVASLLAVVLLSTAEHPCVPPLAHVEETVAAVPVEQVGAAMPPVVLSTPREGRALEPVNPAAAEDPCASVAAQLAAAQEQLQQNRAAIEAMQRELVRVALERDRARFDEATPYGAFLCSDEASKITDARVFVAIESWLRQFPVFLGQGEATWIQERVLAGDWALYGSTSEVALIQFLGARRLASELPPERVLELRLYYADEPGVFP